MDKTGYFFKHAGIKIGLFLRSNWAYILWFALHYILAVAILDGILENTAMAFLFAGLAYSLSIGLALSPVGEFILRVLQGAHPVQTEQDNNYLMPLFEEVYQDALEHTPSLSKKIRLYLSEEKTVNACAIGRKTVIVNRGAMDTFNREEIKGVLAHELGHMANGDTKALLMTIIGNSIFSILILACKFIMWVVNFFVSFVSEEYLISRIIYFIIRLFFDFTITAFLFIGNVILSLNSRYSEYLADGYAFQIGYGEQLKRSLYLINKIDMGGRRTLKEWLMASHPHTNARIARLEEKLQSEQA